MGNYTAVTVNSGPVSITEWRYSTYRQIGSQALHMYGFVLTSVGLRKETLYQHFC
jgi:hypothetical protein